MSTPADSSHTVAVDVKAASHRSESVQREEIVAGYALQQRIGVGSYGEVWRAVGPGELPKAVKLLHGRYDGPTADSELKSLRLMREVRHPFLLNVERIEIVDSRLIIVTELAEKSLEERFTELRNDGFKGIPRDELLQYIRDAADALDYMYENHGLQHLDIKPGNLLLQGGHVKVADFGLIKNLNQTQASLIGGFTPMYAAPELFEGNPGHSSDQYSLAIVYQAMLTGVSPFSGRTAAQLTAQHLSSKPDLSPLSPSDRSVIARALSKNAKARFPSCRGFVDRLSQRRSVTGRSRTGDPDQSSRGDTASLEDRLPAPKTEPVAPKLRSVPLPALDVDTSQVVYRPTLFFGLGGLGGSVLSRLRSRMRSRFGDGQSAQALPLLYVDTSLRSTPPVGGEEPTTGLASDETLAIPLRERQYYHAASKNLLEWLSRRWLYNIPRSQQIEGLRPLGRLAFVDHQQTIRERLQQILSTATNEEAIEQTANCLGLPIANEHPEVYVITSICGGTGGGAVLDAAYLVRDVLNSLGFEHSTVSGLLLHATSRREQAGILQKANAIACLKELELFSHADIGYPGDSACGLSATSKPPFDNVYLVHMGDGIGEIDFAFETENVAEYLYRNSVTPARPFFDNCRISEQNESALPSNSSMLRTFGVATLDIQPSDEPQPAPVSLSDGSGEERPIDAATLGLTLIRACNRSLCTEGCASPTPSIREQAKALLQGLQLETNQLSEKALMISRGDTGNYFQDKLANLIGLRAGQPPNLESICSEIDREFTETVSDDTPDGHPAKTLAAVREQLTQSTTDAIEAIRARILSAGALSEHRLIAAGEAFSDVILRLGETEAGLAKLQSTIEGDLEGLRQRASGTLGAGSVSSEQQLELLLQYATLRCCSSVLLCLIDYVKNIRHATNETAVTLKAKLNELEAELCQLANTTSAPSADQSGSSPDAAADVSAHDQAVVRCFDEYLCCAHGFQFIDFLADPPSSDRRAEELREGLLTAGLAFLSNLQASGGSNVAQPVNLSSGESPLYDDVEPRLRGIGGGHRILAVPPQLAPVDQWKKPLEDRFGQCVSAVSDPQSGPFLCCEVEGVKLDSAIGFVTDRNERIVEMASRNHTRIDVDWCQLD